MLSWDGCVVAGNATDPVSMQLLNRIVGRMRRIECCEEGFSIDVIVGRMHRIVGCYKGFDIDVIIGGIDFIDVRDSLDADISGTRRDAFVSVVRRGECGNLRSESCAVFRSSRGLFKGISA